MTSRGLRALGYGLTLAAIAVGGTLSLSAGLPAGSELAYSRSDGTRHAELLTALKERVGEGKSVGMVIGTIEPDGSTSQAAFGNSGPDARPLDGDSVFEIGSVTKVFTASLLAEMVERGEVKLVDPVAKYLPASVRVPQRDGRQITLLELATQTSGLPRLPTNLKPTSLRNPYANYTVEQLYEFLNSYELTRDIGTQYEYSNLGVGLLGHALARRAGKTYEQILKERVLRPLKMEHTGIALTPWMRQHLAKGHDATGAVTANWDLPTLAGAGALRSTLNDMLRFARANLQPSGDRIHRALQLTHGARITAGRPDMSIGLNWHIRHRNDHDIVWHNGGTGGYHSWIGFDKKRRIAGVILANSPQGHEDLGFSLLAPKESER